MKPQSLRTLVLAWLALLALLAATFMLSQVEMGSWNTVASFGIATAKAVLVAMFFMHLRRASSLVLLFAVAGLAWLVLLYGLSGADFATRSIVPAPWTAP
jgi:cytochrome c oxidase subunit 4